MRTTKRIKAFIFQTIFKEEYNEILELKELAIRKTHINSGLTREEKGFYADQHITINRILTILGLF
jgi:DNA replication initiation complex subunit (GINS family)